MKTYVQPGNTITLTAPYAVASGDGLLVGSIFGIAAGAAAIGEPVETALVGVFDITKVGSQAWTVGAKVYWDDTNKRTTTVATDNTLIGAAVEAVASGAGDTIGRVRLNPLSHFRHVDDGSNLDRRSIDESRSADDLLRHDAIFSIGLAVRMLSRPAFRLG